MELLKGAPVAQALKEKLEKTIEELDGITPHLAIIRVGEKDDDISYENSARKKLEKLGLMVSCYDFPENITKEEFVAAFSYINEDPQVDGILMLRPLPKHLPENEILSMIKSEKDVDGISPASMGALFAGLDGFAPCTARAALEMLHYYQIPLAGKKVCVLGRSLVIGRPFAMMALKENATVTICHTKTVDVPGECRNADILIAACGVARLVDDTYIKDNAVVIDVGIHVVDGKLCGDVDETKAAAKAGMLTPVPGGVGGVTTSVLALQVAEAAKQRKEKQ